LIDSDPVVSREGVCIDDAAAPVKYLANFSADSTASVPLLQKNTRSRPAPWTRSFSRHPAAAAVELGPVG